MEDNLLNMLDKYEQFTFDMITGNTLPVIVDGSLICQDEID